jgi:hypothetical protein
MRLFTSDKVSYVNFEKGEEPFLGTLPVHHSADGSRLALPNRLSMT